MKKLFKVPPHATPIDDISGLKVKGLATYQELSEQETESILKAKNKHFSKSKQKRFIVSESSIKKVHEDMFSEVWNWAGIYRKTQTNIGIKPYQIGIEVYKLSEDVEYWEILELSLLEIAAYIHPFENGNGRHARFYSDLYLYSKNHSFPRWPIELSDDCPCRKEYIDALKEGDILKQLQKLDFRLRQSTVIYRS
ncbi:MAG: mobile mystery protein B [Chlamydiia bacterium]|nr:mobile mystery protein B [Chlamydiia bacterium]